MPVVEGFRLSPPQRRLWKLQEDATDARVFRSQLVLLLEGELNPEALREAIEKVCARHDSPRTVFRRVPGVMMPVQTVTEYVSILYQVVNLSELQESTEELLELERRCEFDYELGPLVRATLFEHSPGRRFLSLTLPALCADRRTLSNFAAELEKTYAKMIGEDEPLQYIQFSEWQNSLAEEEDAAKGKEFWARQDLSHASVVLAGQRVRRRVRDELPRDLQSVTLSLSPEHTARITALSTKQETTPAVVLLAAWQTLLWHLTQQPTVIGNVSEGRSYELLHRGFGLFARVLPVHFHFTEDLRFSEVIVESDRLQRESEEWQDYFSLDEAAESALRYFPFGFEWSQIRDLLSTGDRRISVYRQHCYFEPFDLKLFCEAGDSRIELTFEYNVAAFDEAYIRRLAEQFQTLLEAALTNVETPIAEFEIISTAERQQVVFAWNETEREYQLENCVHELFEQQVERTPDRIAAVFQHEQLTFAELNRRANQLAHHLHAQGVGLETPVGVAVEPSLEMLVAVLGVLKAGGAYVPLDPRHPQRRIDQILQDSGAPVLVTQEQVIKARFEPADNVENLSCADNLAYIIYTSGSSGQPKGVMVQHRSVVNLAAALHEEVYAGTSQALKVALSSPLAFDASVKQLVQLLYGRTLYILPEEFRLDASGALAYLHQHQIEVLDCTPSQLKLLLAAALNKDAKIAPRLVLVGGEAIDESTWSQLAEMPQTRFFNVYGPTECTVDATWALVSNAQGQPTIGRPIPNAQSYILDKNLKPAGIHLTGELYISGQGLARGYLNSPERTAERFIPHALSEQAGSRLYRTGDLARYSPDGSITFGGRNDAQVKIRGHRIELGEIESVLLTHENVRQAVVVARAAANNDLRLVGYVIATEGEVLDESALRQSLSQQLPDYMVPSFIVEVDKLPLTRNGKVDLNALPSPEAARKSRDESYVAPRNEIEETITRVWQEVLGVERIGVNDNFFDAGGHSLLMVQVHSKLSEIFDKNISIVELFAKPTISALAEYFSETNGHKPAFEQVMDRAARRRQAAGLRQ